MITITNIGGFYDTLDSKSLKNTSNIFKTIFEETHFGGGSYNGSHD
jgi:hypothetical protein